MRLTRRRVLIYLLYEVDGILFWNLCDRKRNISKLEIAISKMDEYLKLGGDIDMKYRSGRTMLLQICERISNFRHANSDYHEFIAYLLNNGADINIPDSTGSIPLFKTMFTPEFNRHRSDNGDIKKIQHLLSWHVTKQLNVNLPLSKGNLEYVEEKYLKTSWKKLNVEKQMLIDTEIGENLNLFNVLHKSKKELSKMFIYNEDPFKFYTQQWPELRSKFPEYGLIVEYKLRTGMEKSKTTLEFLDKLSQIANKHLPLLCIENILQHLEDYEQKNFLDS